jgi:hypothetical protein
MEESAPGGRGASIEHTVRHLLRHLDDARALRGNDLVRSLFTAEGIGGPERTENSLRQIRDAVASLIEEMPYDPVLGKRAERYQRILLRCDLGGELHKQVASDLGIGIRQFYRERRAARHYVAAHLERKLERYIEPALVFDGHALARTRATSLRHSGAVAAALEATRDIVRRCDDPRERSVALVMTADLLADLGRVAQAKTVLNDARRHLSWNRIALADAFDECTVRIAACDERLRWESGRACANPDAGSPNEAAFEALRHSDNPLAREFTVQTLLARTWRNLCSGEYVFAETALCAARNTLSTLAEQAAHLRADVLISIGSLENLRDGDEAAARHFDDALFISRHNHLPQHAVWALNGLSVAQQIHGDTNLARRTLMEIAGEAKSVCPPVHYGLFCLRLAELEIAAGDSESAMRYAVTARKELGESAFGQLIGSLLQAEAALQAGLYDVSVNVARFAERRASHQENRRMQGTALRIIAEALHVMGQRDSAREHILHAVELLERAGHPFSLTRAYTSSAKITGSRSHARYAREIASRLASS